MKYLSLFVVAMMFLLAGCGTSAEEKKEDTTKQEEKTTASKESAKQELTEEDKQFIELVKKGEYQSIVDQTAGFGSDAQVNFYFIASAFKSVPDYSLSKTYLNKVKYVPADIKEEVDKLKEEIEANVEKTEAS